MKQVMRFSVDGQTVDVPRDELEEFQAAAADHGAKPDEVQGIRVTGADGRAQDVEVPTSEMGDFEAAASEHGATFEPMRTVRMNDGSVRKMTVGELSRFLRSDEYRKSGDHAEEVEQLAQRGIDGGSVGWSRVGGFFRGLGYGAWQGAEAAANTLFKAVPETVLDVSAAAGHVLKGVSKLGDNAVTRGLGQLGEATVRDAAAAKAWMDAKLGSVTGDRLGYEDWSTAFADFVGNVAGMAYKFAPGMSTGAPMGAKAVATMDAKARAALGAKVVAESGGRLLPKAGALAKTAPTDLMGNAVAVSKLQKIGAYARAALGGNFGAYMETVFGSDGINAYAAMYDAAIENGMTPRQAATVGGEAFLLNYFGGRVMMRAGGMADGIKSPMWRFLAGGEAISDVMALQAAGNKGLENEATGRPVTEGMGGALWDGKMEGLLFHGLNAVPGAILQKVENREAYLRHERYRRGFMLDMLKEADGAAKLYTMMSSDKLDAAIRARREVLGRPEPTAGAVGTEQGKSSAEQGKGAAGTGQGKGAAGTGYGGESTVSGEAAARAKKDDFVRLAIAAGVPETMSRAEMNNLVDVLSRQRDVLNERVRLQINDERAEALSKTIEAPVKALLDEKRIAEEDEKDTFGRIWLRASEKITDARDLDDPDFRKKLVEAATREVVGEVSREKQAETDERSRLRGAPVAEQVGEIEGRHITSWEDAEADGLIGKDEKGRWTGGMRQALNIAINGTDKLKGAVRDGQVGGDVAEDLISAAYCELGGRPSDERALLIDRVLDFADGNETLARRLMDKIAAQERSSDASPLDGLKRLEDEVTREMESGIGEWADGPEVPRPPQTAYEGAVNAERLKGTELKSRDGGVMGCQRFPEVRVEISQEGIRVEGLTDDLLSRPENAADAAAFLKRLNDIAERNGLTIDLGDTNAKTVADALLDEINRGGLEAAQAKLDTRAKLFGLLFKTTLGNGVTYDETSFRAALEKTPNGRPFVDRHGNIYGIMDGEGVLHFNPAAINFNTPIHEYGHLALEAIRGINPALWRRGMELVRNSEYFREIKGYSEVEGHEYAYLKGRDEGICDEALATLIGDRGARLVEDKGLTAELKAWLKEVWKAFRGAFGLADLTEEQIEKMTLGEFVDAVNAELLKGSEFGTRKRAPLSKTSIRKYDEDGGSGSNGLLRWKNDRGYLFALPVDLERTQPGGKVVLARDDANVTDWIERRLAGLELRLSEGGKVYVKGRNGFEGELADIFGRYPTVGRNDGLAAQIAQETGHAEWVGATPEDLVAGLAKDRAGFGEWAKARAAGTGQDALAAREEAAARAAAEGEAERRWQDSGMGVVEYIRDMAERGEPGFDIDWETARAIENDRAQALMKNLEEIGLMQAGAGAAARAAATGQGAEFEGLRDHRPARSVEQARAALKKAGVVGKSLTNERLGLTVVISNRDVAKMTSEKATKKSVSPRLHALAVANADKVFKAAFVDGTHADTHGRKEVRRTHRLGSAVYDSESGRFEPVMITVLEYVRDGVKMYTVEAIDVAKYENSAGQLAAVTVGERQAPIAEFVESIANRVAEFNGGVAKFSVGTGGSGRPLVNKSLFIAGRTRVADDAGVGEQTPGALAMSRELSTQGVTPLSQLGTSRKISLPISAMEFVRKRLTGDAAPAGVVKRLPGGRAAAHTAAGRLYISADVFGTVDKTDMAQEKTRLKQHGFYRDEDPNWCATQRPADIRAERKRSDEALANQLANLGNRRARGVADGGQAAATQVFADEIARIVLEMPQQTAGVLGGVQTIGKSVRAEALRRFAPSAGARGTGQGQTAEAAARAEAGAFLDWSYGGPLTDPATGSPVSRGDVSTMGELANAMFGKWLVMPREMETRAPTWSQVIEATIANDPRLKDAFEEVSRHFATEQASGYLVERIRKQQSKDTEAALQKLRWEARLPISAGSWIANAKETLLVGFHDKFAPVYVRISEKLKIYKAAQKALLRQTPNAADRARIRAETDRFIGDAERLLHRLELSRTACERGAFNEGNRYFIQMLRLEGKAYERWGLTEEDRSLYLRLQRVVETQGRAASDGMSARQAQIALDEMKARLGPAKYAKLEQYGREFFGIHERELLNDRRLEAAFGKAYVDYLRTQEHYVTTKRTLSVDELAAVDAARAAARAAGVAGGDDMVSGAYAYASAKGAGDVCGETAWTMPMKGSMAAAQEARSATWMKVDRLQHFLRRNQMILDLRDALLKDGVEGVRDLRRADGAEWPDNERYGHLHYMVDGEKRTLVVPRQIADAFRVDPDAAQWITKANGLVRALYIDYNPAYWAQNVKRNQDSIEKNMPGMRETRAKTALRAVAPGLGAASDLVLQALVRNVPRVGCLFGKHTVYAHIPKAERYARILEKTVEWQRELWAAEDAGDMAKVLQMNEDFAGVMEMLKGNFLVPMAQAYRGPETSGFAFEAFSRKGLKSFEQVDAENRARSKGRKFLDAINVFKKNQAQQEHEDVLAKVVAYLHDRMEYGAIRSVEESGLVVKQNVSIAEGERAGRLKRPTQQFVAQFFNMVEKGVVRHWKAFGDRPGEMLIKDGKVWVGRLIGGLFTSGVLMKWMLDDADGDEEKAKAKYGFVFGYAKAFHRAYQNCSDYVKENYNITPIWNGPDGYTSVVIGGALTDEDKLIVPTADYAAGLIAHMMGIAAAPSLGKAVANSTVKAVTPDLQLAGPIVTLLRDTVEATLIDNPTDYFRGAPMYDQRLWENRNESWEMRGQFAAAVGAKLWNDFGGRSILAMDVNGVDNGRGSAPETLESVLRRLPVVSPAIGRMIKIQVGSPAKRGAAIREQEAKTRSLIGLLSEKLLKGRKGDVGWHERDFDGFQRQVEDWTETYGLTPEDVGKLKMKYYNAWIQYKNREGYDRQELARLFAQGRKQGLSEEQLWIILGDL